MEKIPAVFNMEEDKLVVVGEGFIGIQVARHEVDEYLKQVGSEKTVDLQTRDGKIIFYSNIDEVVSEKAKTEISIGAKDKDGYSIETITLPSIAERDECIELVHEQLGPAFSCTIQPKTLFDAILLPGIVFLVSAIGGGLLTWFCQLVQEPLQRTHIVKSSVYYAYQVCKFIGPTAPMALTVFLSLLSLFFMFRLSFNRPTVILLEKQKNIAG